MVDGLLAQRALRPGPVEAAMRAVARHLFVAEGDPAYQDTVLGIGEGQTISAPHMVAMMAEALDVQPGHRVLEVGGGSGYHAAVLAHLAAPGGRVVTVERIEGLARRARESLARVDTRAPVEVIVGDGSLGAPDHAPYDRISVAAAAPDVPPPLVEQLAAGGRLVIPVGARHQQDLMRIDKRPDGTTTAESLGPCLFVPLVGAHGWPG